jgi:hypothetical protein
MRAAIISAAAVAAAIAWSSPAQAAANPADAPQFVRMQPFIFSLVVDNQVAGIAQVTVGLQLLDPLQRDSVEAQRPKLRDAFNRTLIELGRLYIDPRRPIDSRMLATHLQAAANQTAPDAKLRVLILDASARKPKAR